MTLEHPKDRLSKFQRGVVEDFVTLHNDKVIYSLYEYEDLPLDFENGRTSWDSFSSSVVCMLWQDKKYTELKQWFERVTQNAEPVDFDNDNGRWVYVEVSQFDSASGNPVIFEWDQKSWNDDDKPIVTDGLNLYLDNT